MKKVLLFSTLLIAIVLTGCSSKDVKVLDCNQSLTASGYTQDINVHAEYEGDNIVYYSLRYDMDLSSVSESELSQFNNQDLCALVKANMSAHSNAITNCKHKIENKHLILTADYDLDILLSEATKKVTIDELKVQLENQRYSCIIK